MIGRPLRFFTWCPNGSKNPVITRLPADHDLVERLARQPPAARRPIDAVAPRPLNGPCPTASEDAGDRRTVADAVIDDGAIPIAAPIDDGPVIEIPGRLEKGIATIFLPGLIGAGDGGHLGVDFRHVTGADERAIAQLDTLVGGGRIDALKRLVPGQAVGAAPAMEVLLKTDGGTVLQGLQPVPCRNPRILHKRN